MKTFSKSLCLVSIILIANLNYNPAKAQDGLDGILQAGPQDAATGAPTAYSLPTARGEIHISPTAPGDEPHRGSVDGDFPLKDWQGHSPDSNGPSARESIQQKGQ